MQEDFVENIERIGRHTELITQGYIDPNEYARDQVAKYKRIYGEEKVELRINVDFK